MREQLLGYLLRASSQPSKPRSKRRWPATPSCGASWKSCVPRCARWTMRPTTKSTNWLPPGPGDTDISVRQGHAGWGFNGPCGASAGSWRAPDYAVAAGIFFVASMLVFPAVQQSCAGARLTSCQSKLSQLGMALAQSRRFTAACHSSRPRATGPSPAATPPRWRMPACSATPQCSSALNPRRQANRTSRCQPLSSWIKPTA